MATAPGSESLAKKHRDHTTGDASRAGPCDPQDPQPRIPDDTPQEDAKPLPAGDKDADHGAAPEKSPVAKTTGPRG
jgi:hypothetical protein